MLHYKKTFVHLVANTNTLVAKLGKHSAHTRKHHRARHASNGTKGRVLVKHFTLRPYLGTWKDPTSMNTSARL